MENLMEKIDLRLIKHNLQPISDVVNNRAKCIQYIKNILKKYDNKVIIPFHHTLDKYDFRVKHVVFSFGLGFLMSGFCDLKQTIKEQYGKNYDIDDPFIYVWLTVCLYHDFGYFIGPQYVRYETLNSFLVDYNIFRTLYCSSRYSERLYFAYYDRKYREQAWTQNGYDLSCCEEVGDHGILGGYMLFKRLCASEEKPVPPRSKKLNEQETFDLDRKEPIHYHQERIPMYQDICFRIMEHNIWKEDKHLPLDDPFREIDAEHFRNIDQEEPLLFLLCLVDTIEMTKRFCRYSDSGTDKNHFIFPKTLGSKVYIDVSYNTITIDYRELKNTIQQNKYSSGIEQWQQSVTGLSDWVKVDVDHFETKNRLAINLCSPVSKQSYGGNTDLTYAF